MFGKRILLFSGLLLLLAALASGCAGAPGQEAKKTGEKTPGSAGAASFAGYREAPVKVTPAVKPYTVDPDLGNITNKSMFRIPQEAKDLLVKNGFVVVPNPHLKEFFMLYEEARYQPFPAFVTTDSMLHNYHLFFNHLLRVTESDKLAPELKELNRAMLSQTQKQYTDLKGTAWENAARRNVAFFAVAARLADSGTTVPALVKGEVAKELTLIEKHQGVEASPVMNSGLSGDSRAYLEDYSQYMPRGHYERSDLLQSYFKAMMWYGRLTFRLKNEDEARSAVLISLALDQGGRSRSWEKIYETTNFFVGRSDDVTYHQVKGLLDGIYGPGADLRAVAAGGDKWQEFLKAAGELQPPVINSSPDGEAGRQPGFRFMGQRYTLDADVFQRLVYPEVQENRQGQWRVLPRGLDVPAALGSKEAYAILDSLGDPEYKKYPENMAKMKSYISGLPGETWTQNLYWGWLHTLRTLTWEKPQGYPSFMRSAAWARKELNTFLGSWTELKHDTVLYAKPMYAEAGGGDNVDDRGYVEPNPHLYARLAALAGMTREGLQARGLLSEQDRTSLERLEKLALSLKDISEKELAGAPLTDEDYELIRSYGVHLEHFWLEALRDEGIEHRSQAFDRPAALVVDVANNPGGGQVLQEATGNIFEIYVVVPVDGKLRVTKGGVYSYYEFPWPMNDRLTDKKWHQMLSDGQAPPLPGWTGSFIHR